MKNQVREITSPPHINTIPKELNLKGFGYIPGNDTFECVDCTPEENQEARMRHSADKKAWRCQKHASDRLWAIEKACEVLANNDPEKALYLLLFEHSKRVSDLIKANSQQVIRRRVLNAKLKVALGALQVATAKFRFYGRSHREKISVFERDLMLYDVEHDPSLQEAVDQINKKIEDTSGKAWVNDQLADEMDRAMTIEINPDDYGRA